MNYLAIGLMSGSSLDGLDMVLVSFDVEDGKWRYRIKAADCLPFSSAWKNKLKNATELDAQSYLLLDTGFGEYCATRVNSFLEKNYRGRKKPDVIGSHGHTTFHRPDKKMTHQLGDGAALAAGTKINVVSDLRSADIALNGQGAPIVPIGEKLLYPRYRFFMNIGGICNVSVHEEKKVTAFDVSPANRVLNLLAAEVGKTYDAGGKLASGGKVDALLLEKLNTLRYYRMPAPKSLANSFGTDVLYPIIRDSGVEIPDALATLCEHIAMQTMKALIPFAGKQKQKMLITGGGAWNDHLIGRLKYYLDLLKLEVVIPDADTVNYKEALIMALIAVLRLREEPNVLASVTGAVKDSCGGALWTVK